MFDFIENLNIKFRDIFNNNEDMIVMESYLEKEINEWVENALGKDILFKDILLKVGIYNGKKIYLNKIDDEKDIVFSYSYDKLDNSVNKIRLFKGRDGYLNQFYNYSKLLIANNDNETVYLIDKTSDNNFDVKLDRKTIVEIVNGVSCSISYYLNHILIIIKKEDGFRIKLNCTSDFNFKIENELELKKYLMDLTLNDNVRDVYKRICEISLGDESNFSYFKITFEMYNKEIACLTNSKSSTKSLFERTDTFEIFDNNSNIIYKRYLPYLLFGGTRYVVNMEIINDDYKFHLKVKPKCELDKGEYAKLYNEIELRDYLLNVEFPIKIEDIFRDMCEISLGDVSQYTTIELEYYYKDENIWLLSLYEGNFKYYKEVRNGKEISLDNDGNFTYISNNKENNYDVEVVGNRIKRYEYKSDNGIDIDTDNKIENPLEKIVNDVKNEKVRARKLIDEIIK